MTYNIPPGRTLAQNSIGGSVTSGFDEGLFRGLAWGLVWSCLGFISGEIG